MNNQLSITDSRVKQSNQKVKAKMKKVKSNTLRMVRNTDISLLKLLMMEIMEIMESATHNSFLLSLNHLTVLIAAIGLAIKIRMWSPPHSK